MRREAMVVLPSRVAELAVRTGLQYRSVTIRATRSKWGSCNGRNDLSLSLYLMTLPEHLRDFVILHELCTPSTTTIPPLPCAARPAGRG